MQLHLDACTVTSVGSVALEQFVEAKPVYCLVDGVGGERVGPRAPRRRLSRRGVARRRVSRTNSGAESMSLGDLYIAPLRRFSQAKKKLHPN